MDGRPSEDGQYKNLQGTPQDVLDHPVHSTPSFSDLMSMPQNVRSAWQKYQAQEGLDISRQVRPNLKEE